MYSLPEVLSGGEPARLIPVVADTSKEVRAVSVVLAAMNAVPDFARVILDSIGQRFGTRAKLECLTEVTFRKSSPGLKCRPDGYLALDGRRGRTWTCLIEAKVGRAELEAEQITQYAALARENGVDALLTISNQFAALPSHHPLSAHLSKSRLRGIELYHLSWSAIVTHLSLLLGEHEFESQLKRDIIREVERYLSHESSGVTRFDRMNAEWKTLNQKVQAGAPLSRDSDEVKNSVAAWEQECRDVCLLLTTSLGRQVRLRLSRAHADDPALRLRDDCEALISNHKLECALDVPDAASPIEILADLQRRSLTVSMSLAAPRDKQRSTSRIRWLLRQLSKTETENVHVRAKWPGRAAATQVSLAELQENPELLERDRDGLVPTSFQVLLVRDIAGKFQGSKTFIQNVEEIVPEFYEQIGQHLRPYVPPPPKPKPELTDAVEQIAQDQDTTLKDESLAMTDPDQTRAPQGATGGKSESTLVGIAVVDDAAPTDQNT
jgi:hypothetical protein